MRRSRGVVLLHTLILLMVLAYISILLLQWTLSRAVTAKAALDSNENTSLLSALQAKISTCLSPNSITVPTDCSASLDNLVKGCMSVSLGSKIDYVDIDGQKRTRLYSAMLCPAACATLPCPCKIRISLCPPNTPDSNAGKCTADCNTPSLWTR